MSQHNNTALFLDFDGVLCDSVAECFVSSWLAYFNREGAEMPGSVSLSHKDLFARYRPFIRRGADYMLLQYAIENDITLFDQRDFDKLERTLGTGKLEEFHRLFYGAREKLLRENREYWIGLNVIYSGILPHLAAVQRDAYILTTKEISFVIEILRANSFKWNEDRILCSGRNRKADFIVSILDETKMESALFIDDQIDHFGGAMDSRIKPYLAAWGYVKPEWLTQLGVPVLTLEECGNLLRRFL